MQQEIHVRPPAGIVFAPEKPGADDGLDGGAEAFLAVIADQLGSVLAAGVGQLRSLGQADLHRRLVPHVEHVLRAKLAPDRRRLARGYIIRVGMGLGVRIIFIGGKGKGRVNFNRDVFRVTFVTCDAW